MSGSTHSRHDLHTARSAEDTKVQARLFAQRMSHPAASKATGPGSFHKVSKFQMGIHRDCFGLNSSSSH